MRRATERQRRTDVEDERTHTHRKKRDPHTLSSFSCDVIEAEQQTLKPEAELGPPPQPKITDCTQDLHTRTFPLAREDRGARARGGETGTQEEMSSLRGCHARESLSCRLTATGGLTRSGTPTATKQQNHSRPHLRSIRFSDRNKTSESDMKYRLRTELPCPRQNQLFWL